MPSIVLDMPFQHVLAPGLGPRANSMTTTGKTPIHEHNLALLKLLDFQPTLCENTGVATGSARQSPSPSELPQMVYQEEQLVDFIRIFGLE